MLEPEQPTGRIRLQPRCGSRLAAGHLWIYDQAIESVAGAPESGDVVDVYTHADRFCGRGLYNPLSKIRVRLLTTHDECIDRDWWTQRIRDAVALRERVVAGTNAYRLIHGESDHLPGLIVDRYHQVLVMQTLSIGMERRKERLAALIAQAAGLQAVYLRNDAKALRLEGVAPSQGFLLGDAPTVQEIVEGPARFRVDVAEGQKTGWFCDQRENRLAVAAHAAGADVLDLCCHTGGFSIHAALRGARSVVGVDAGAEAVAQAQAHAALNGVAGRCTFRRADAFDELRALARRGNRYRLIILDPPSFAKHKASVPRALAGYKDLNLRALRLLDRNGILATCSCSHYVSEKLFRNTLWDAARDAGRRVRVLETRSQSRDHPVLAAMPETRYLTCLIVQAL